MQRLTHELEQKLLGQYTMKIRCQSCGEWHVEADDQKIFYYAQFDVKECPACRSDETYLYVDNPLFFAE